MGVFERLDVSWEDASFAVIAALVWLSASLASCPQVSVGSVRKAGVEITEAIPSLGPIVASLEDDDREFQEDYLEPCGLPGVRLASPPSLSLSQVTPPQSVWIFTVTPANHPLRC
jgi:hypothetical protein